MAAGDGLISMKPTSIAHAGTSASINADGGVDFSAVTSLSLNGVFTGDYDNYLLVVNLTNTADSGMAYRWRVSGTDASGSNYTRQYIKADSTSISSARATQTNGTTGDIFTSWDGLTLHIYGPALAQPTAERSVNVGSASGARIVDSANTHSLSTAYDGITLFPLSGSFTGTVHVFGYEE